MLRFKSNPYASSAPELWLNEVPGSPSPKATATGRVFIGMEVQPHIECHNARPEKTSLVAPHSPV
jgi:hypothetical protein